MFNSQVFERRTRSASARLTLGPASGGSRMPNRPVSSELALIFSEALERRLEAAIQVVGGVQGCFSLGQWPSGLTLGRLDGRGLTWHPGGALEVKI
jgi:hypothetical protein